MGSELENTAVYAQTVLGQHMRVVRRQREETVYQMTCDDGFAKITDYALFPGINLQFNEIHCEHLPGEEEGTRLFEINYCLEGLFECAFSAGGSAVLREGGFAACCPNCAKADSRFPLRRYRGISVTLDLEKAQRHMDRRYPELSLRIWDLPERLCPHKSCLSIQANRRIKAVFQSLEDAPQAGKAAYYRVKTLELLVLMSALPPSESPCPRYLSGDKKELMHHIRLHLRHAACENITLAELARTHGVCLSVLKRDFARLYGVTPGAYRRQCRMQLAARLLTETDHSVTEIASRVGYQNVSKFAAAFQEEMGASPSAYRKTRGLLEHPGDENGLSE